METYTSWHLQVKYKNGQPVDKHNDQNYNQYWPTFYSLKATKKSHHFYLGHLRIQIENLIIQIWSQVVAVLSSSRSYKDNYNNVLEILLKINNGRDLDELEQS